MKKEEATKIIEETFENKFDINRFSYFISNLLKSAEASSTGLVNNKYIKEAYRPYVSNYRRITKYTDKNGKVIDVIVVNLKEGSTFNARARQRNLILDYLKTRGKDAILAAFTCPDQSDWRFSFVKLEYDIERDKEGKIKDIEKVTSARRFSYLVGEGENSHTAKSQLVNILQEESRNPTFEELEQAFNVEVVTKEFFSKYKELFHKVKEALEGILKEDTKIYTEFQSKEINTADFSKKLLGQIVFLYFIQKKGWLGVDRDKDWGTGPKNLLRKLFNKEIVEYSNFFNDVLEPLFYEALATDRGGPFYWDEFKCRIPFLNGGLFEPICDYSWVNTDINLSNSLFSNSNITKEGDSGDGILDVFDRFNFTVKEDEPLEREVAIDPEMLGKVFENLLEVKDRKSKGTYYTPREIVHYMCQESLINYLSIELKGTVPKEDIEFLMKEGESVVQNDEAVQRGIRSYEHKIPESIRNNADSIDNKLAGIKVCDPAVGSGAFLVGMMTEIIKTRTILTTYAYNKNNRSYYDFKRHSIQNCLFGVDVDPGAVELAKLRLWLSLIVDEEDIKRIKPLPNLDYKIMQGNSLIEEYEGIKLIDEKFTTKEKTIREEQIYQTKERISELQKEFIGLYNQGKLSAVIKQKLNLDLKKQNKILKKLSEEVKEEATLFDAFSAAKKKAEELIKLQKVFFEASQKTRKNKLREQIEKISWELIEATLKEEGREDKLEEVKKFRKSNTKPFFLWKLYFADVFQKKGGFNIVIANPPYTGEKNHKDMFRKIRQANLGKYYLRNMDIFYFFFHLSLDLGTRNSNIAFITTNYYITATGAKKLRRDFKKRAVIKNLINFNELKIFESAKGQHNMITILQKGQNKKEIAYNKITHRKGIASQEILQKILHRNDPKTQYYITSQENLYDGDEFYIRLGASKIGNMLDKIIKNTIVLEKFCDVYEGIQTGANDIFIFNGLPVFYNCLTKKEQSLIKPFYKNSDIMRYHHTKNSKYILYFKSNLKLDDYPNIKNYLKENKGKLVSRAHIKRSNQSWHTLLWPRESKLFLPSPKIITSYRPKMNSFCYTEESFYSGTDTYYIVNPKGCSLKFILGVINSKLIYIWLRNMGKVKGEILEMTGDIIKRIPIMRIDTHSKQKMYKEISSLVDQIHSITKNSGYSDNLEKQTKVKKLEKEIDQLVYRLYELIPKEIKVMENL